MARIGTKKKPAILRVRSFERAHDLMDFCREHGIEAIVGVESNKPEDISDLELVLNPPEPIRLAPKIGRNDPCPCGSGLKTKKCCPELTA